MGACPRSQSPQNESRAQHFPQLPQNPIPQESGASLQPHPRSSQGMSGTGIPTQSCGSTHPGTALAAGGTRHAPIPLLRSLGSFQGCLQLGTVPAESLGGKMGVRGAPRGSPGQESYPKPSRGDPKPSRSDPKPTLLTFSTSMFLSAMTARGPWERGRDGMMDGGRDCRQNRRHRHGNCHHLPDLQPVQAARASRCVPAFPKSHREYSNPGLKDRDRPHSPAAAPPLSHRSPGARGHRAGRGGRELRGGPARPQKTIKEWRRVMESGRGTAGVAPTCGPG